MNGHFGGGMYTRFTGCRLRDERARNSPPTLE